MECRKRLEQYLQSNGVPFHSMTHAVAFTGPELAAAQHVPGKQVAKVVMAKAGDRLVMLVLPAHKRANFQLVAEALGVSEAMLAHEDEFSSLFPDCMVGAMPPFGNLYGVPVYLDAGLTDDPEIVFAAGTHTDSIRLRFADYIKLVNPTIATLTV
jgi:Ala-tRNA(Pro) deacylase